MPSANRASENARKMSMRRGARCRSRGSDSGEGGRVVDRALRRNTISLLRLPALHAIRDDASRADYRTKGAPAPTRASQVRFRGITEVRRKKGGARSLGFLRESGLLSHRKLTHQARATARTVARSRQGKE